ncbi:MAG TPA: hypothetical protein RMH99_08735 [Sandaracinaceae bacterium LLY-WYZ-13_1]|nr:hypothetical protein [Sandaracinaceae bacterium LLY-WYZ-13_1]
MRISGPFLAALLLLTSCTAGGDDDPDTGPPGMDASFDAGPPDAGPRTCDDDGDCDDGFGCTIDECVVGNVCEHEPLDARCEDAERCVVGRGCVTGTPTDCTDDGDCDDGMRCNGTERCIRDMCIAGTPLDCDDGNPCTDDICDESATSGCRYEVAEGCDGGTRLADAGPMCDPFDPSTHYAGSFRMLPGQACDAGLGGSYTVSSLGFSVTGDTLTVTAGRFTLTQTPVPTGPDFDVTGSDGCATVRLTGSFACETQFGGMWTATHTGSCSTCGTTDAAVSGRRL